MEGLGCSSNVNKFDLSVVVDNPDLMAGIPLEASDDMFKYTPEHLMKVWLILLGFALLFVFTGNLLLHRVSKDTR